MSMEGKEGRKLHVSFEISEDLVEVFNSDKSGDLWVQFVKRNVLDAIKRKNL